MGEKCFEFDVTSLDEWIGRRLFRDALPTACVI